MDRASAFEIADRQQWVLPNRTKPARTVVEVSLGHVAYTDAKGIWR